MRSAQAHEAGLKADPIRCPWAGPDPLYITYHDTEWGVPLHDDNKLFEFLVLEGAQAGLSWLTVLKKRAHYQKVFDRFDPMRVAAYDRAKIEALYADPGIIRNRLKIEAAVNNAKAFLKVQDAFGSFDAYIWQFVGGQPIRNTWHCSADIPAATNESHAMSADLKQKGFKFTGPTICYALMQAIGMVNDHTVDCFRYPLV
jgi:DNA-3-methyladenine glycosylase I